MIHLVAKDAIIAFTIAHKMQLAEAAIQMKAATRQSLLTMISALHVEYAIPCAPIMH